MDSSGSNILLLVVLCLLGSCRSGNTAVSGDCNSYEREKINEGHYECIARDPTDGTPLLGVGFNVMNYYVASDELSKVGANYTKVVNGSECLNETQIKQLFKIDMANAVQCVSGWLEKKAWSALSLNAKSAVVDMGFNYRYIGCYPKLFDFVNLKNALSMTPPDYSGAVNVLQKSTWCGQEEKRCLEAIKCLQSD